MIEIDRNIIIAAALIWLLACSLLGYHKGFLREAYTIAEIIVALIFLYAMSRRVTIFTAGIPSFGCFLVIWFVLRWIGKLLDVVNHIPLLGSVNRTLGVLLGFFKGLLVLGLLYSWLGGVCALK